MIKTTIYAIKPEQSVGCTPEKRRKQMLAALEGCIVRSKYRHNHPENMKHNRLSGWENTGTRYRMCTKKERYRTQGEANKMISRIKQHRPGVQLRSYWCGFCNGWHLTHSNG